MKVIKKALAAMLAALMVFSMVVPAYAATELTFDDSTIMTGSDYYAFIVYEGDDYIGNVFQGVDADKTITVTEGTESVTVTLAADYSDSSYGDVDFSTLTDTGLWHYGSSSSYCISTDATFSFESDDITSTVSDFGSSTYSGDSGYNPDDALTTSFTIDTSSLSAGTYSDITLTFKYQMKKKSTFSWSTSKEYSGTIEGFTLVVEHAYDDGVVTDPTCTEDGYTTYTCSVCGDTYTDNVVSATGHSYVATTVDATCTEDGYTTYTCSVCGDTYTDNVVSATGHSYVATTVDATCTEDGYTTYTCSVCGDSYTETIAATGHTAGDAVIENEVEATCGTAGSYDTVVYCTVCGEELSRETTTVAATGDHSYVKSDDGAGTITYTCSVCGDSYTETYEVEDDVDTVTITTIAAEGTTISINGTEVGTATTEVEAGSTYTVTTTGAAGIIVETTYVATTSYTAVATGAATYTTVADTSAEDITITFVDEFGNLVATWTADDAAAATALPDAYEFVNVTFDGWSATLEEVQAATESMVVTGTYSTTAMSLTVTADGATIAVYDGDDNATEYSDSATVSYYSTKVTVSADDATVWYVNGSAVGYGSSYTFYVGADVTLTYGTDAVSASTVVTAINASAGSGCRAIFLASRSVADGDTLVESGWVYGKDMAEDDLVLENVGTTQGSSNGTVKKAVNQSTSSEAQFALSYGVSAMSGSAVARAFVTYTTNGETVTVYSSALTYTY